MIPIKVLRAAGLSDAQIVKVIDGDQQEKLLHRREKNRKHQQNHRSRKQISAYSADSADASLLKKESKEEKKGKKASRLPASPVPADWQPSAACLDNLRQRGIPDQQIDQEVPRFRDHAAAHGRLLLDRDAAFRNWMTSPYRKPANSNGTTRRFNGNQDPTMAACDRLIAAAAASEAIEDDPPMRNVSPGGD
jgi:hypothetical protein